MLERIKRFLTGSPEGKRVTHYAEIFAATFLLAALGSAEHLASLHQPLGWSLADGAAAAGGKAVLDLARPLAARWLAQLLSKH